MARDHTAAGPGCQLRSGLRLHLETDARERTPWFAASSVHFKPKKIGQIRANNAISARPGDLPVAPFQFSAPPRNGAPEQINDYHCRAGPEKEDVIQAIAGNPRAGSQPIPFIFATG
jgi:hypothetical protein